MIKPPVLTDMPDLSTTKDTQMTLRVENTTEDTVELIYEITQKLLRRAEQTTPDIPGSIYSLGSIDYVNLVMQNDEVSN